MAGTAFSAANWTGYDSQTWTPSASHTDFTVLIDVSTLSSTWKSNVQSDGADIRLTKSDGTTELAYDLIDWAYNAGAPTGWIRSKFSGASGTSAVSVRCYVGYTGGTAVAYDATETYGSDNAYASHWENYYSLDSTADRTSNGRTLTEVGGLTTGGSTGKVGSATDYDGTNDEHTATTGISASQPWVFLAWINPDDTTGRGISTWKEGGTIDRQVFLDASSKLAARVFSGGAKNVASSGSVSAAWTHIGVRTDGTNLQLFIGGSNDGSVTSGHAFSGYTTPTQHIGWTDSTGISVANQFFDGDIDEVQVHSAAISNEWISDEYAQSNDQSTFWGTWSWTANAADASPPWSALKQPAFFTHLRR